LKNSDLKIYSNDDERIQLLGQILRTSTSRKIYQLLIENQLNAKEIGKVLYKIDNPRLPNIIHHLHKMVEIGLITSEKKLQRKKGHTLTYYKAIPMILIVPKYHLDKVKSNNTLKSILKI